MNPDKISLRIGRLVLHGFADADQARIGAALQSELQRLLVNALPSDGLVPAVLGRVDAGSIAAGPAGTPEMVGAQVARRVAVQLGVATAAPVTSPAAGAPATHGGRR
jgi:hypothetical protein